jgi:hypothetical protein
MVRESIGHPRYAEESPTTLHELHTPNLSFFTCHLSPVICHLSFVTCHFSPVIFHLSFFTCHLSPVIFHLSFFTCHNFKPELPSTKPDKDSEPVLI